MGCGGFNGFNPAWDNLIPDIPSDLNYSEEEKKNQIAQLKKSTAIFLLIVSVLFILYLGALLDERKAKKIA